MKKTFAAVVFILLVILSLSSIVTAMKKNEDTEKKKQPQSLFSQRDGKIDSLMSEVPFYRNSVIISRFFDKLSGMNATTALTGNKTDLYSQMNTVLQLSDGYLSLTMPSDKIDVNIEKTIDFSKQLKKKGIDFIYLEIPHKIPADDKEYLKYGDIYHDYSGECEQKIHKAFSENGIEIISLGKEEPDLEANRLDYYFKTDLHWIPETGLLACRILSENLNEKHGFSIDTSLFDINNFDTSDKRGMMGALGKKVTEVYCNTEPITILRPKYETDLSVRVPAYNFSASGTVDKAMYDTEILEKEDINPNEVNMYDVYAYGNTDYIMVHNNLDRSHKRILVLKSSMANVMTPFLSCAVENLDIIDIRAMKRSINVVLKMFKPDAVVMIYGTREFLEDSAFNFK